MDSLLPIWILDLPITPFKLHILGALGLAFCLPCFGIKVPSRVSGSYVLGSPNLKCPTQTLYKPGASVSWPIPGIWGPFLVSWGCSHVPDSMRIAAGLVLRMDNFYFKLFRVNSYV